MTKGQGAVMKQLMLLSSGSIASRLGNACLSHVVIHSISMLRLHPRGLDSIKTFDADMEMITFFLVTSSCGEA
jgi:hypothetical protein